MSQLGLIIDLYKTPHWIILC